MTITPANKEEQYIFALEDMRAEIQYEILRCLKQADISQAQLAKRIGVSAPWVSQILGDDANLTIESIVKIFLAFGKQCKINIAPLHAELDCDAEPVERVAKAATLRAPKVMQARWIESESSEGTSVQTRDTISALMKVIEGRCSGKHRSLKANDNSFSEDLTPIREFA
ncbi:helix-turn-helix transcriptional regulator [Brucella intermedia]|uniref:helix-turn-helix transcriptional regulator n=1 Tax=Brucella intermedia TaxID=94625 RepID=UPI00224B82E2|nr:helix-turn-helix transcriptional regulator [Brucella intermedia]